LRQGAPTEDNGVGREDLEVRMEFLDESACSDNAFLSTKAYKEEVELVGCTADAVCEKQNIPLQPGNLLGRVLEAYTWSRHCIGIDDSSQKPIEVMHLGTHWKSQTAKL